MTSEGKLAQFVRVRRALYYGSVGLVVRWMEHVVTLEGYGGCVDLCIGTHVVGNPGVSSDIGAVKRIHSSQVGRVRGSSQE